MKQLDWIKDYRIVWADDEYAAYHRETADELAGKIREITGAELPVQSDEEAETEREILLGPVRRTETQRLYEQLDWMSFCVKEEKSKILLAGNTPFTDLRACDCFAEALQTGMPLFDCPQSALPEKFPEKKGEVRAMTYNVLVEYAGWGAGGILRGPVPYRMEPVTGIIRGYEPDILCCEEVFERWATVLPHLLGRAYGTIEMDRPDGYSNRTFLLYRKRTVRVLASGYEDIPIIRSVNKRVVVWALLELVATGKRFLAFGTHWECTTDEDRTQQAEKMGEMMERLRKQYGVESISMGDFNCLPKSNAYARYLERSGQKDCEGTGGCDWSVDHIFHTDGLIPRGFGRESGQAASYASDHFPLYCDFSFVSSESDAMLG